MAISSNPTTAGASAGNAEAAQGKSSPQVCNSGIGAADASKPNAKQSFVNSAYTPSSTLKSRSFFGLVLSQFLAAFNDQASHIVAFYFATDMLVRFVGASFVDTKLIVMVVTACFIVPFFLFSPLAGVLADKYSKRNIIVSWKLAEVAIMAVALFAFLLPQAATWGWPSPQVLAVCSSILLISVVFLMGTHSAFFVPAKYGMMPEILDTSILSRGNGILEGSSFLANILGTVFGGWMYGNVKSDITTPGVFVPGKEWMIGLTLFVLAIIGAAASFIIERLPAADPNKEFVWEPWTPLKQNLRVLRKSRPLMLATAGIAFFLFMTLFLRQSLLLEGETHEERHVASRLPKPPAAAATAAAMTAVNKEQGTTEETEPTENEAEGGDATNDAGTKKSDRNSTAAEGKSKQDDSTTKAATTGNEIAKAVSGIAAEPSAAAVPAATPTSSNEPEKATNIESEVSYLIGLVGLGVGIGSALAGYFSGNRLELGLVPLGALMMIFTTALMAVVMAAKIKMRLCLVAIGAASGLYIVPLYTLLQHRSPKESKGSLVAMSNFLNVTGGLVAVIVFFCITSALQKMLGLTLNLKTVQAHPDLITAYEHQLERALQIPKLLFLVASGITILVLALAWWQRPDFVLRAISWLRSSRRRHLRALGLDNIPSNGQVILISNSHDFDHWVHVVSTVDRFTRFVAPPDAAGDALLRRVALGTGVMIAGSRKVRLSAEDNALARGLVTLGQGYMLGLSLAKEFAADTAPCAGEHLLSELRKKVPAVLLPVYCGERPTHPDAVRHPEKHTYVVIGDPLPADTTLDEVRAAVVALGA